MNAEETKAAAAVMIAWAEGKKVQAKIKGEDSDTWNVLSKPNWNWQINDYRIVPEPTEVEVLYHPTTGDFMRTDRLTPEHARQLGWTLRRATIHPETK